MEFRFIVRIVVMAAAFAGLAACSIPSPGEYVRVKGEVAQLGGGAIKGCSLRVYDDGTGELIHETGVGNIFDSVFFPGERLDGMRFTVGCKGAPASAFKVYTAGRIANAGYDLDLGRFKVWHGRISVSGKVVDESGKKLRGCIVALYTQGQKYPVHKYIPLFGFQGQVELGKTTGQFYFEVNCAGYKKYARSQVFNASRLGPRTRRIKTRTLVVSR
jgi:hypothetical protein